MRLFAYRSVSRWLCAFLLVGFTACRDEQAGPHRGARAPAERPLKGRVFDQVPQMMFHSGATLGGGAVQYLGSSWSPAAPTAGQKVMVAHYFRLLRAAPEGWSFFVHVVDAATGQMVVNADHDFQDGALPLARWPLGKVVEDLHTLTLPEGVTGSLRVLPGFWQGDARLPVDQPQAQDGQNRLLGPTLAIPGSQLPEYHVHRAAKAPRIDGVLDDAAWAEAAPVTLVNSFDGSPAPLRTTARLLYDDQYLYVAFDCEDPDVWGTLLKRDEPIYTQEVVEIFLDANGDGKTYNELEVSPNNTLFDAYFPARREGMDLGWDSKMKTAVKVRGTLNNASDKDEGWSVEMQIPIARLAEVPHVPPVPGDRWRFNLYRLDLPDRKTQQGQAFSPLFVGDFHALPRFGWLVFEKP